VNHVVHLLADAGFDNYQETINTSRRLVEQKPDFVQRFVNASIEGWVSYLTGDPAPAKTAQPPATSSVAASGWMAVQPRALAASAASRRRASVKSEKSRDSS